MVVTTGFLILNGERAVVVLFCANHVRHVDSVRESFTRVNERDVDIVGAVEAFELFVDEPIWSGWHCAVEREVGSKLIEKLAVWHFKTPRSLCRDGNAARLGVRGDFGEINDLDDVVFPNGEATGLPFHDERWGVLVVEVIAYGVVTTDDVAGGHGTAKGFNMRFFVEDEQVVRIEHVFSPAALSAAAARQLPFFLAQYTRVETGVMMMPGYRRCAAGHLAFSSSVWCLMYRYLAATVGMRLPGIDTALWVY